MKHTILFSDVHLKPFGADKDSHRDFLAFLRAIDPHTVGRVICMGDLFDFWFEYRHVIFAGYYDVLRILSDLRDRGVELHLCCGNHDLWAGDGLAACTGLQVHHQPIHLEFGGRQALLLHGDGLNPADRGYLLFRKVACNPLAQRLFRRIHPDCAMAIAQFFSRRSRSMLRAPVPAEGPEARAVRDHARSCITSGQEQIVICGHAHAPVLETITGNGFTGQYINTGDWPMHRSYVCFDGEEFIMKNYCSS